MDPAAFKAYDIRGLYPQQVDEAGAYALGRAYAAHFQPRKVVVAGDARLSTPALQEALTAGLLDSGVHVVDIGRGSSELLYFSVGAYGYDGGLMVTASHNPAPYNGFKMVGPGARPISGETGITALRDLVVADSPGPASASRGTRESRDVVPDYCTFLRSFVDTAAIPPVRIVANPNFGYQGVLATRLLEGLPVTLHLLNGEPDGTFPKGQPDPFLPENRAEFLAEIRAARPDLGVTWDADGDRVFFATGAGNFVEGYHTAALLTRALLGRYPGESVVYDVRYTWAIEDAAKNGGGQAILSRVGHSFIKEALRRHQALFCGEASGHIYFRDYFYADTGLLPLLVLLELLGREDTRLDELAAPLAARYPVSGEMNFRVAAPGVVLDELRQRYAGADVLHELDGLTVEYGRRWRFNVRVSNTESLLRLNVEACDPDLLEERRHELFSTLAAHQAG